jgi:hypothetical protein
MTVHTQPEYQIRSAASAPKNYPHFTTPDSFSEKPFLPDYKSRRQAYFAHILKNPAPENTKPAWFEIARLAAGGLAHEGVMHSALDFIDARKDCSDFVIHGFIRLMQSHEQKAGKSHRLPTELLSPGLLERTSQTILNYKYFPDEPGLDSLCTWTENHYILFTSAAYLAGQMYPDKVFSNSGETGSHKMKKNRARILQWLNMRFRSGFSEWLSHVYYDEDLVALLSLYDFAEDKEIKNRAETVIDLILLDISLNSFKGVFGSTHGRAYENTKKWASNEGTTDTSKLLFGMGIFSGFDNMSSIAIALSGYRTPMVIDAIAKDQDITFSNRQRMGHRIQDAKKWGLTYNEHDFESGMLFLTNEAYIHPKNASLSINMFDAFNWWQNSFLNNFSSFRGLLHTLKALKLLPLLVKILERDVCRNMRQEVNIYTYKTPDYMLSTAQDYRKGFGGDQQHIWQATLGHDAVCFTTHPAKIEGVTPNYWAGNGLLPRAAQYKNVSIIVYNIKKIPALYVPIKHFFTHAWLPKDKFDEVTEQNGWIFTRKGDGYLALYSQNPYFWNDEDTKSDEFKIRKYNEDFRREVIVKSSQNIWICQMGRRSEDGAFTEFVEKFSTANVVCNGLTVNFQSPGIGEIKFGWNDALQVNGIEIALDNFPRYDNPFVQAEYDPSEIKVSGYAHQLHLDWRSGERFSS